MNDDRTLLERAAKAAGLGDDWKHYWNEDPLADDGAALRLAVKLNLIEKAAFLDALHEENAQCDGDYDAATRRAIVRAAAALAG